MKAIETLFDGYRFRSRLEARWGVFFKTLGIPYEYEKEGYALDGTWYLPDFWLPKHKCFIEIKGQRPTDYELNKAYKLAEQGKSSVFVFWGEIGVPDRETETGELWDLARSNFVAAIGVIWIDESGRFADGDWHPDEHDCFVWSECQECYEVRIRSSCSIEHGLGRCCQSNEGAKINTPRLIEAYTAARQARFER